MLPSQSPTVRPTALLTLPRRRRRPLGRRVLAWIAASWLFVVLVGVVGAPWLAPYPARQQDLTQIFAGPSFAHLLGTDSIGRDVLSRLMFGGMSTITSVAAAVAVFVVLGVVLGLVGGYFGGMTDRAVMGLTTIVIAMPGLVALFVVLSVFRNNTLIAMITYGLLASPTMILLVRSSALSVRHELFVDAAKVSGLPPLYIIFSHVLPRTRGLIVVQATVFAATALIVESALAFLGFGVQPPEPTWGNMVNEAATKIALNPFMLYPTGGIIALTALAIGVLGDIARDRVTAAWSGSKLTTAPRTSATIPHSAPRADATLLSVEHLHIGYRDASGDVTEVVKDVSFDVARGEIVGIVGESGSGKSTVAFGVLGVTGDTAVVTGGHVHFDGTTLTGLSGAELRRFRGRRIAYVAQEPMVALDPNFRVGTQLAEAVRVNDPSTPRSDVRARVLELLGQVELPDPLAASRKYPHELSGGMAQRVSIAFALAGRPELLIADEPTTALDVTIQAGILGLILRLRDETDLSVVVITHDWGVVADLCDRVVVMYRGEIVEEGDAESIFDEPAHEYTQALLASNPHAATPGEDLPVVTGTFQTPSMIRAASTALPEKEIAR